MAVLPVGTGLETNLDQLAQMYQQTLTNTAGTGSVDSTGALGTSQVDAAAAARSNNFGDLLTNSLQNLENLDLTAQNKSIAAATGDLTDVHDYIIAATKAQTATELTTTLRNKALDSFNEIMRMPL